MLKFPGLARLYFGLLHHLMDVYSDTVARLPEGLFVALMRSLEVRALHYTFTSLPSLRLYLMLISCEPGLTPTCMYIQIGLNETDVEVAQSSLEALGSVLQYKFELQTQQTAGAASTYLDALLAPRPEFPTGLILHFMEAVFKKLLLEDNSQELVEAGADALLPMILCAPAAYQQIGEQLLRGQEGDERSKGALVRALNHLMGANGVTASMERRNKRAFRANLHTFVADVRGMLRKR